ncbi:MAG: NADH-quinone oxidoreductase subunit K [Acidiphilium sp. 34-60-192]|nr:MAG: NADH-quinone oxidoreductase subunit K [Acidiphilium sp. 34-60-192]
MATVPLDQGLLLAAILFALGLAGVLMRRNLLFILMSLEVMLGQVMFILILTLAATEVSVGLALILLTQRRIANLDADASNRLKG